jgi:hypothetical protein
MANEIYHRSWWGNATNTIDWGDEYFEPYITNKLFVRVDYYENSTETDALLNNLIC